MKTPFARLWRVEGKKNGNDGMKDILASPTRALVAGLVVSVATLAIAIGYGGTDVRGLVSFLVRWLHIAAAIVWLGMIWFVNFIQLVAVAETDQPGRAAIMKHIVPRVAATFRQASNWTVASGVALLFTSGYLGGKLMFGAPVFVPTMRNALLWTGTLGAMAMYMFVHMMIWPGLRIVLGMEPADTDKIAAARLRVATYARLNLVLAVPVTVAMVAAAHLY